MEVGRSLTRVDAFDKVTGRAKYTDDLHGEAILVARILHSTIANGVVRSMDISEAQAVPGVVKVLTCFDVPDIQYPTPGHPWSVEEAHQDVADRKLPVSYTHLFKSAWISRLFCARCGKIPGAARRIPPGGRRRRAGACG